MASQLLNPKIRNAELRAFAYMSAKFERGARTPIECLLPLLSSACSEFAGDQFDAQRVIDYVKNTYKLDLPYFMVEGMVTDLQALGSIKYSQPARIYVCVKNADSKMPQEDIGFSIEEIDVVEQRLSKFARSRGINKPYSVDKWGEALVQFFKADDERFAGKIVDVQGALLRDATPLDNAIIAEFIQAEHEAKSKIYEIIEKIFYGVLVAEFLTRIAHTGNKIEYKNLEIVYDTTVLIRMLGISGNALRAAALQMHQMLQDLGCNTYYFSHTASELTTILEATANNLDNVQLIHFETREALLRCETTGAKILVAAQTFEVMLGQLNIFEKADIYKQGNADKFQVDELKFQDALKATGLQVYQTGPAREYDAKSLALVVRLREGKTTLEVSNCKCLLVTHNHKLATVAKKFLIEEGQFHPRFVGPIFTLSQITTLAWVVNDLPFDPVRISKELIANCYKASIPQEGWEKLFWEMIESVPTIDAKDAANSIVIRTAREIALRQSHGHAAVLRRVNIKDVLDSAEKEHLFRQQAARDSGYDEGARAAKSQLADLATERAKGLAKKLTDTILWIVFLGSVIMAALIFFSSAILPDNGILRSLTALLSTAFAALSLNELVRIVPMISMRRRVEDRLAGMILKLQKLLVGVDSHS